MIGWWSRCSPGMELAPLDPESTGRPGSWSRNWYKFDRNVWMFDTSSTRASIPGADLQVRPLSRPQVRSGHPGGVLPVPGLLRTARRPDRSAPAPAPRPRRTRRSARFWPRGRAGLRQDRSAPALISFCRGEIPVYPTKSRPLEPGVPAALSAEGLAGTFARRPALRQGAYYPAAPPGDRGGADRPAGGGRPAGPPDGERGLRTGVDRATAAAAEWNAPGSADRIDLFWLDRFAGLRPEGRAVASGGTGSGRRDGWSRSRSETLPRWSRRDSIPATSGLGSGIGRCREESTAPSSSASTRTGPGDSQDGSLRAAQRPGFDCPVTFSIAGEADESIPAAGIDQDADPGWGTR